MTHSGAFLKKTLTFLLYFHSFRFNFLCTFCLCCQSRHLNARCPETLSRLCALPRGRTWLREARQNAGMLWQLNIEQKEERTLQQTGYGFEFWASFFCVLLGEHPWVPIRLPDGLKTLPKNYADPLSGNSFLPLPLCSIETVTVLNLYPNFCVQP